MWKIIGGNNYIPPQQSNLMKKFQDLSGQRFGRLVVLYRCSDGKHYKYKCLCDCGNETEVAADHLRSGHTTSCGCERSIVCSKVHKTHGMSKTRLYKLWGNMIERCENPKNNRYKVYGAKGIKVCDEWHKFEVFQEWALKNGYDESLTKKEISIERIDVSGDYCPRNCKWIPLKEQHYNKSNTRYIAYNGKKQSLSLWSAETGLSEGCITSRLDKLGWSIEDALTTPSGGKKTNQIYLEYDGKIQTLMDWSRETGIPPHCIRQRLYIHNWSIEDALSKPPRKYNRKTEVI